VASRAREGRLRKRPRRGAWGESPPAPHAIHHFQAYASLCRRVLGVSQEAVKHIARVNIVSGDRIDRIVAKSDSALARACARVRNVERGGRENRTFAGCTRVRRGLDPNLEPAVAR
jgi:hypothetical protein